MIAVSYLKSKTDNLTTIKKICDSSADMIHVDLMDGLYVKYKNFEIDNVIDELKDASKPLDVHLMVLNPEEYISKIALLKPDIITIHLTPNIMNAIKLIKEYNIKVGIAINPNEESFLLDKYIDLIDYVLIMGVYPGLGGQTFINDVLKKVNYFKDKDLLLGIDGGVNGDTIKDIKKYNFDIIVSGSFICMNDDYDKQISILR